MTLTAQGCPAAQQIPEDLKKKISDDLKVNTVDVEVVFDPPWTPERMNDAAKKKLGITDA